MNRIYLLFILSLFMLKMDICAQFNPVVKTGLEVLKESDFALLKGKNIGLITNPTGVDNSLKSTIDIFYEENDINLVAIFSPEHGIRGNVSAGDKVKSGVDPVTGIPVYSLYGKNEGPTASMLKGIDVLVYDIQDIGVRSYTYISTMGKAMEAAAKSNVKFVVLDRPNPLGGLKMEGPLSKKGYFSIVGAYPIPYVYGLTVGELAMMINGEGLLQDGAKCDLTVVKMQGWKRDMLFDDTGLPWVPSSPHIPHANTAFYYVATGILGELMVINNGVGYTLPFRLLGAEWIDAQKICNRMNALGLKGVAFRPIYYKPYYTPWKGQNLGGIQIYITNPYNVNLMSIQFLFLQELHKLYPEKDILALSKDRHAMFDKVCGSDEIRKSFFKNYNFDDIKPLLYRDLKGFRLKAGKYYLYD